MVVRVQRIFFFRKWLEIYFWNNKEIQIDSNPVYYKNYFTLEIIYINDLLFNLNTKDSYNYFLNKIDKSNFLQCASLRHSITSNLKEISLDTPIISPSLTIENNYFNFTTQQFTEIFSLAHLGALESYVKAFQYKVINYILLTSSKLCKIGFRINDACTFCNDEPESLYHLFLWMTSLQNVLDWFRIVLVWSIGSANPSFCTIRCIWSFIQTMPFIKFIWPFHSDWKILFVGLQKKPNTS